ncbi:hypothetical protein [Ralstonia solanacearum]|uniref:hypothetical protein n=1 Tax=Ralstonia solanacearum TaxID=305 RepID=UPI001FFCA807|nr:hypothetical protein [Ralstonia solanacearum]
MIPRTTATRRLAAFLTLSAALAACGGADASDSTAAQASPIRTASVTSSGAPYGVQACSNASAWGTSKARSAWVYPSNNQLAYKTLNAHGDTIMDYASAGYMGGGVALPARPPP